MSPVQQLTNRIARARLWVVFMWACLTATACDGPGEVILLGPLPKRPVHMRLDEDAGVMLPEGARPCKTDAECADAIDCTVDECLPAHYCRNTLDNSRCSDGLICNGVESCDPLRGCVGAPEPTCNDQDPCTIDRCDEEAKACVHDIRDFDRDGEADFHCGDGTDCDDFDATRGMNQRELCADGVDNDCDDVLDERDCGSILHDSCNDPLDISAGGRFEVPCVGAAKDFSLSCGDASATRDVVFSFRLDAPRDVKLIAKGIRIDSGGDDVVSLALSHDCGGAGLQGARGVPGALRARAWPAGEYFGAASVGSGSRSIVLTATFSPATEAPQNTTCDKAKDISKGGHISGDFVDVGDSLTSSCAIDGQPDLFYKVVLSQSSDLEISAVGDGQNNVVLALRKGGCDPGTEELRCQRGPRVLSRFYQLPPGEYVIVMEGPSTHEIGFGMDVAVLPASPPPPADACVSALPVTFGSMQRVPLQGFQDDVKSSCHTEGPDAVLSVMLDEPRDLDIKVDAESTSVSMALQSTCSDVVSERVCRMGQPLSMRMHDVPAGMYYMVIDAGSAQYVNVLVNTSAPSPATAVSGNDTCYNAVDSPATGGVFKGDTRTLQQDYKSGANCAMSALSRDAAFRLTLPSTKRVFAKLLADFDSVLMRYDSPVSGNMLCSGEPQSCWDDGPDGSGSAQLDETLKAGTYYLIVDGYDTQNAGAYLLDVSVNDP